MIDLIIIGAGGFGLEVAAYAEDCTKAGAQSFRILGFLDDTKPAGSLHAGYSVLGNCDATLNAEAFYILAVGSPTGRKTLGEKLAEKGARFATLIHPLAYVAASAEIAEGAILAPFAFVGPMGRVAAHGLLNIYASVGHEATLGKYAVLSPYAGLHGSAVAAEASFLGAHANLTLGTKLGANSKLSAGSIAYTDIPENVTALGNPAKFRSL